MSLAIRKQRVNRDNTFLTRYDPGVKSLKIFIVPSFLDLAFEYRAIDSILMLYFFKRQLIYSVLIHGSLLAYGARATGTRRYRRPANLDATCAINDDTDWLHRSG